ncbi:MULTISPECIES: LysM peptidoglycan-binding domain-containing protein [unclassified Isoptericola]|uniref:LysM peptidoglycan-binding domain-containing protein n=1 Tax=unclassified Isoptericola TaxID=2623355 RepID=UPI00365CA084
MSGSSGTRNPRDGHGLGRLTVLALVACVAGVSLALRGLSLAPRTPEGAAGLAIDGWVELAVLAAGLVAAAWLFLSGVVALACVAAVRLGRRWRAGEAVVERLAPAAVRRLVRSAVGVGVGAGLTLAPTAALAAETPPAEPAGAEASVVLDLGWQSTSGAAGGAVVDEHDPAATALGEVPVEDPDETVTAAATGSTGSAGSTGSTADPDDEERAEPVSATPVRITTPPDADGTRVVLRGDTLWDIARDALGGHPSDAEILREATRWHEANRAVVGADPDRILPGQVLSAPA